MKHFAGLASVLELADTISQNLAATMSHSFHNLEECSSI
jgi:hypothetical protein